MSRLLEALSAGRVLLMDGAMGTQLQQFEPNPPSGFESWNVTHPERIRSVHRAYVDAGADVIVANTFLAHRCDEPGQLIGEGVALARTEARRSQLVIASIGPMADSESLAPLLAAAVGADGVLLETWSELPRLETLAGAPPLLLSLTFWRRPDGSVATIQDETPESLAAQANGLPLGALGVNCGRAMDLDAITTVLMRFRKETRLPLFARPNAGTPRKTEAGWEYPLTPAMLAERLPEMIELGVRMVGGCCGTTPAHIAAMRPMIDDWNGYSA